MTSPAAAGVRASESDLDAQSPAADLVRVYLNGIGGAAQYYARTVRRVKGVHLLEQFGVPEAMWHLSVEGFVAIVTMDAHGNSLHADVEEATGAVLEEVGAG